MIIPNLRSLKPNSTTSSPCALPSATRPRPSHAARRQRRSPAHVCIKLNTPLLDISSILCRFPLYPRKKAQSESYQTFQIDRECPHSMASLSPPRTAADHAFVTLITSDSYLPGALAQSAALNDLHPIRRGGQFPSGAGLEEETDPVPFTTVCLVTPETVSVGTIKQLRRTFDLVIGVELIEGDRNSREIKLLGRPDLHQTFTKLHVLRLAQFASVVFLDADVLPLRPMSHLLNMVSSWPDEYFEGDGGDKTPTATNPGDFLNLDASTVTKRNPHRIHNPAYPCPISAAPDSGWPDIFNSGVIVLAPPGERGFKQAMSQRSWDGGDQGTLNEWAGNQAGLSTGQGSGGPGWNRLSFKYNVTPTAAYTYAPAYAKFGSGVHAVTLSAVASLGVLFPSDRLLFRAVVRGRPTILLPTVSRPKARRLNGENRRTPIIFWWIAGMRCTMRTSVQKRTRKMVPRVNSRSKSTKAHGKEVREARSLLHMTVVSIRVPPNRRLINQTSTRMLSHRIPITSRYPPMHLRDRQ
ncbi:Glycogenin-2 OS=Homo sapiens GN=GYG2 PE=1 SV=2 [Rhizoctonia solani AG-1 IB]|uniref:Glycogenin-2 n=1 Tax=Thanatephorus cucumeris (strain AG1-IB / isolate 7/3/14) TaxID=1108050 RepID=A0A0B7FLG5_THACB|nr:Glycogenin-2 OS=Homo sapiens GN=GYG2 PE=1 SV=2 [Rhizoctonia solani AG-1 IB]